MDLTPKRAMTVGAAAVLLLVGACSSDGEITAKDTTEATTTQAPDEDTTTTEAGDKEVIEVDDPGWAADASGNRGRDGETFTQDCPPNPDEQAGSVWGAGTYTDDSSVCTAAVQSGLITFAEGGEVTYEIAPGLDRYDPGSANGVTSSAYGSWGGSFTFPDAPPGTIDVGMGTIDWGTSAAALPGDPGARHTVTCPPDGSGGSVWGSGPYTADSSICTAAVHAGVISLADGGEVTIEIGPGEAEYPGGTANGITTGNWGAYDRSFTVDQG